MWPLHVFVNVPDAFPVFSFYRFDTSFSFLSWSHGPRWLLKLQPSHLYFRKQDEEGEQAGEHESAPLVVS